MLIQSPRHTSADLDVWEELEYADRVHGRSKQLAKKAARSIEAIRKFASRGRCYAGVSWGKDSVVMADLILRTCRVAGLSQIPFVWIKPEPIYQPDCMVTRDAYLAANVCDYHEFDVGCMFREGDPEPHATGSLEAGIKRAKQEFGGRWITGLRADESTERFLLCMSQGLFGARACRPLSWWDERDIFGWMTAKDLPVNPVYGCLGGGRWPRDRLRVCSLGGRRGDGGGRREWEMEYYGDRMREIGF